MNGQWYLIYRYRWVGKELVRERDPIDGVHAAFADAAIQIAATRNDHRTDETFNAAFCTTVAQRMQAADLDGRHTCKWWSRTEFIDWMCQPAYDDSRNGAS